MGRGGRPRQSMRPRNKRGKVRPLQKDDPRYDSAQSRMRRFEVTETQAISPLAGFLCGVLFLRGELLSEHVGRFYSFLQMLPRGDLRAITIRERVQGGRFDIAFRGSKGYHLLVKHLGRARIDILHNLANDRLICSVGTLRNVLGKVPLTRAGSAYMIFCETHATKSRPNTHAKTSTQRQEGQRQVTV